MSKEIWVCGEVLIDLIPDRSNPSAPKRAIVGGGPANTAKALAKLGLDSHFIDGISTDAYGVSCKQALLDAGVKLDYAHFSDKQTCTADVTLNSSGSASYFFTIDRTATFDFSHDWLPDPMKNPPAVLQIGTLATIVEPAASILHEWASKVAEVAPIVFDPNVRSSVVSDRDLYQAAVAKWTAISSVIKVSEDDIYWLYPGKNFADVARNWIAEGAALVVVTKGLLGLEGFTASDEVKVPGVAVNVVDTVGAGDTVGAVVVEAMLEHGLAALHGDLLKSVLARAAMAAAINCSRAGANPPTSAEIDLGI